MQNSKLQFSAKSRSVSGGKIKNFYFLVVVFTFSFLVLNLVPLSGTLAQATPSAALYFLPAAGSFEIGQIISVRFAVNTGDNPINLVEASLSFSKNTLEVVSFSKTGTILNLWFKEPSFSNSEGTIYFSGGIINSGFSGLSRLLIINFKTKATGSAWLKVNSAQVLANDGFGTNILEESGQANFTLFKSRLPKPVQLFPKKEEIKIQISSSTHPDETKWYKEKNIILTWNWQAGITNYSYVLDQKPETIPDNSDEGISASTAYLEIPEGIWYFHLKAKTVKGWQEPIHFKIQIDTTPPTDLKISSDQGKITFNPSPTLRFEVKDELSGLDYYTVKINENEPIKITENYYQIPKQKSGDYLITVRAYDRAGNYLEENSVVTIQPVPSPRITYWTKEILIGETVGNLIVRGTALPESKVKFYLNHEKGKANIFETQSNKEGKWDLVLKEPLSPGKYQGYAVTEIEGENSPPSVGIEIGVLRTGLRFLFWIIWPEMIWGLIIFLICGLGILLTLYLGARRKFIKCDIFVKKVLGKKDKGVKIEVEGK